MNESASAFLEDPELAEEIVLMAELMVTATESERRLCRADVDRVLLTTSRS